ncbi:MFS transporter [Frankia sp. CNm7]|uniref:MFS transporter n=1 Tax=Frankia nepalensis TaxID=1836974 RepID=A0A937USA1_9ACTN|nr:MFS transporter [Frankia nepalensis]MBL7495590.1 MFS transporter [Frankia nepalensis]MBL7508836.1 MFS transporter [Frankia nepalensis]MBL7523963.1 MFS transporter [Frankia nepalensis]MBL7630060.1 MFS transporter [Frankia nepalensis]
MRRSPWATLVVLALAQFAVVLDVTIVNVALPDIQRDLGFSAAGLQWVINSYTLLFGGFLLLGGRAADLLGRRRMFVAGLVLFGAASLVAGLSTTSGVLVATRAAQGLGGALMSPAALSILTVTFPQGRDRNIALGVWGGLAGLGGTLGVVAGGVLVDALSWRWVFFVNVPIVVALLAVVRVFVAESVAEPREADGQTGPAGQEAPDGRRAFDAAGAILGTAGLLAVVYGVVRAEPLGWGSWEVMGALTGGVALLAAFVVVEVRSVAPLVPPRLFRSRSLTTASLALALNGGAFLSMFFLTALFLQQVRGDSALAAGLHFLPMGVAAVVAAAVASQLVTRIGTRPVQLGGAALSVAGLVTLIQAGADGSYLTALLPGLVLFGFGIIGVGVPAQIAAVVDVEPRDAGAASGVVTTFYQIGGALGLAVVSTLANSRTGAALAGGASEQTALVDGFHRGLAVATGLAAAGVLAALASPRVAAAKARATEAAAAV